MNKKRQENETIKDWLKRTSIKDDSWLKKAKHRQSSADVNIVDSDIATIEALHDLLLDAHGYSLDFVTLKRARELTAKMHKAINYTHCCKSDSELLKGYNKYLEDYIDAQHLYDGIEEGYLKTL